MFDRVQSLPLQGRLRSVVSPLLALMRPLNGQLTYSDATIEHLAAQDPRVPRLRSVPSIGPVTAAAFLAAIDDAQRFPHAHQLEAYLGLVPAEYSSGETQRRGAITKAGHSRTRWLLIQAAVSILRRRPPQADDLRTWAVRIAVRRARGRPRPSPRRHPLCAAARWQRLRAPARSVSASSRCCGRRPHEHVNHSRRGPASATKSASVNSNGPRDSMNTY